MQGKIPWSVDVGIVEECEDSDLQLFNPKGLSLYRVYTTPFILILGPV